VREVDREDGSERSEDCKEKNKIRMVEGKKHSGNAERHVRVFMVTNKDQGEREKLCALWISFYVYR
jgi:hypothetical protein